MIYLNNAATSYPKPSCVKEAVQACLEDVPASQFRGGMQIGKKDIEEACRERLGRLLGISEYSRIYFTSGATEALNTVLGGLLLDGEILVTQTEHNSVLRPVRNLLSAQKLEMKVIPCEKDGRITLAALESSVTSRTRAIVVNHCSNVTGCIQDMDMVGRFVEKHGLIFIADVSQSAGCIPIDAEKWGADALVFTGHKSLMGIQGTGGFYIRPGLRLIPLKFGGTGTDSAKLVYENDDYEYEPGTHNLPGITALYAGVGFILETGVEIIHKKERNLMEILYEELERIPGIQVYGNKETCRGPVLSMNFTGLSPSDSAYILGDTYGITVRAGLHCSPLIHQAMGTGARGTVRVSVSWFTTEEEIRSFIKAAEEIAESLTGVF